jgi:hypothetical protein
MYGRNLCRYHYHHFRHIGELDNFPKTKIRNKCSIESCDRLVSYVKYQLCSMHYGRFKRHGDPLITLDPKPPYLNRGGYLVKSFGNKKRYIHRMVMEEHLGRRLKTTEYVHHINGIKTDNRIENLQLFESNAAHTTHHQPKQNRKCSIEGCNRPHEAHGYCTKHDYRYRKYGDPNMKIQRKKCSICGKPAVGGGLCSTHYSREHRKMKKLSSHP